MATTTGERDGQDAGDRKSSRSPSGAEGPAVLGSAEVAVVHGCASAEARPGPVGLGKAGEKSRPRDLTPSNSAHGPGHDAIGRSGAGALRAPIESIVRRTIGPPGGSDDLVDLSVIALAGGWLRIAVEDNERARPCAFDVRLLFESTKRELPRVGLALLAGEIVAAHGGRLLARPAMRS